MRSASVLAILSVLAATVINAAPAPTDAVYTCDSATTWHSQDKTGTCPAGTVCSANAAGNPCQSGSSTFTKTETVTGSSGSTNTKPTDVTNDSGSNGNGGTRFVAYWENYANLGGTQATQLDGVTHVILSFADLRQWATPQQNFLFAHSTNGDFDASTAATLKGMKSDLKVTAALGGWGLDAPIAAAVRGAGAMSVFIDNTVNFVKQFNLDGIDIDWEFPAKNDVPNFVTFIKQLREKLGKDKIISIAVGARTDTSDVEAYTKDTFTQLNDLVDMWNVMTYDYVNRYSTKTEQQGGGRVVDTVMAYYQQQGMPMKKANIGFAMNAKYFTNVQSCSAAKPIGCPLPGQSYYEDKITGDNFKSGWLRFNSGLDSGLGINGTKWATDMRPKFEARPKDGSTEIKGDLSNAWYDGNQPELDRTFWTWTSEKDMGDTCKEWKTKVGGMMVWSMNHDDQGQAGGSHFKALAACVKGAK
ncbi:uncharacterized protein L203_104471 [Cryptococcus depauperatus CBS 7841]|uniref:GH18 domain-containing protein n=1 Tax=Cryptococcus depauperatus CBS 7841 TaxID=1295531 RepID=A0AAJ8JVJ1_9TREE